MVALLVDSGASGGDLYTNDGTLALSGLEAGALVEYSIDGGGTWAGAFVAAEGLNEVQVRQTDAAGNVSAAGRLTFTLDTAAPAAPVVALLVDSGASGGDLYTNDGTLALSGLEAGAMVEYSIDGGGTWAGAFAAAEGLNEVQVRQTDAAGNVSAPGLLTFTLDTAASRRSCGGAAG